jgi:hypothetical protein
LWRADTEADDDNLRRPAAAGLRSRPEITVLTAIRVFQPFRPDITGLLHFVPLPGQQRAHRAGGT